MRTTQKTLLSPREVAETLGVSRSTVQNYIDRHVLPVSRIRTSRLLRIRAEDVEALLEPRRGAQTRGQ